MQYLPSAFHEEAHLYKIVPTYIYTKPQKRVCDVPWTFQTNETSESPGLCFLTSSPWTLLPLEPFTPLLTPEILSSSKIHFLCVYTMEYYSAVKKNSFESVLMRWMKLEPIIQSEVSQKEKHQYSILTHIYGI